MSDLGTQLRSYFDENVERVTAEDVLAGRRVGDLAPEPRFKWRASPRLAVGLGFGVTVLIIGGSLGLGLVLQRPGDIPGSGRITFGIGAGTPESTGWGLLGVAVVLASIAMVFVVLALRSVRTRSRRTREEKDMATTFDTPPVDHELEEAHRANRWLIAAVVVLVVAVVALGAWVVNDLTSTSETAPPAEVQALVDDFQAAWNAYDGDALAGFVDETEFLHVYGATEYDLPGLAALVRGGESYGTQVGVSGDYIFVESGSRSYIVAPAFIRSDANSEDGTGVLIYTVGIRGGEWKIIRHEYIGSIASG
jgi:uncharacterized membrane protein